MVNKRKRTSTNDGDHVEKKSKQSTVTNDANGTSSSKMTDCEVISFMMPNALPNRPENPERNPPPRVHRARIGESVHGEIRGNRPEIIVWDSNEPAIAHQSGNEGAAAPTTTTDNRILPDDGINDGDTDSSDSDFDVIDLTSDDDNINSYYSIENDIEIDETSGLEDSSDSGFEVIELTSEDDDTNSYYLIENYIEIDETSGLEDSSDSDFEVIDLTSDDDTNSCYLIENDDE